MAEHAHHAHGGESHAASDAAGKPYTDPVCGMKVGADLQKTASFEGQDYHFCSYKCLDKFKAAPASYVRGDRVDVSAAPAPAPTGTIYTCPMHPQIRQDHPGN